MADRLCKEMIAFLCIVAISRMIWCNARVLGRQLGFSRIQAFSSYSADPLNCFEAVVRISQSTRHKTASR